jgi:tetratricopeptide (TPR) repeat protein
MRLRFLVLRLRRIVPKGVSARRLSHLFALLLASGVASGQIESILSTAQLDLDHKDYGSAERLYRQALSQQPNSPEILSDLGLALQMQGRSSEAIRVFQQALKYKYLPGTYALLAEERCRNHDLDEARPMLAKLLREQISTAAILAVVAPCYLDLDEPVESVEVYQALANDPAYPEDLGRVQLTKSYLRSAQFFGQRLKSAPGSEIYIQALEEARKTGSVDARSSFAAASQSSPYFRSDRTFLQAVAIWKLHPNDAALLYQLTVLSGEEGIKQIQLCVDRYPNSPYVEQLQADIFASQGKEEEALDLYLKLVHDHPDLPDLRYSLGMLYRRRGEWDKALAVFQEALAADPNDERAAARASEALVRLAKYDQLQIFLAPRIARQNPPLWARLDLATAEQELGNYGRALQQLVIVERATPSDTAVHYRLMRLYILTGDTVHAEREKELCRKNVN